MNLTKLALNPALLKKQKRTEEDIENILEWSNELKRVFEHMKTLDPEKDDLYGFALIVERCELEMQKAWGFPQDRDYHSWWYKTPHCKCPYMDNQDMFGTPYRHYVVGCPVHKANIVLDDDDCAHPHDKLTITPMGIYCECGETLEDNTGSNEMGG